MGQGIEKQPDWQSAFAEFVAGRIHDPFEWGRNDCALFAADAVEAMTGRDLAKAWRGRYSTAEDAGRMGYSSAVVIEILQDAGAMEIPVRRAMYGDVCLVDQGEDQAWAICNGKDVILPGPKCLVEKSRELIVRAFRLP